MLWREEGWKSIEIGERQNTCVNERQDNGSGTVKMQGLKERRGGESGGFQLQSNGESV